MSNPVIVRLEVEHMRHAILHHFANYQGEVTKQVEAAVDKAIKEFDFDAEVRGMATQQLRERVRREVGDRLAEHAQEIAAVIEKVVAEVTVSFPGNPSPDPATGDERAEVVKSAK